MSKETYRIDIEIEAKDKYSSDVEKARKDVEKLEKTADKTSKSMGDLGESSKRTSESVDHVGSSSRNSERHMTGFQRTIRKTRTVMRRLTGGRHEVLLRATDRATHIIRSVGRFASRTVDRTYRTTLRAVNMGGRVIRGFSRALLSLPAMVTVGLGVVGVGSLGKATIGSSMNFEDYGVSMDHWLNDDKKTSRELMEWMGQKADLTPFTSQDIFPAMTGAISLAGNNKRDIQRLTSAAIDMAALTPGSSVEDAMQAIQNAKMGEMTMMKRFGFNISKDDMDSMGWAGFVDEIEKRFEGGSLRLSETARGQMNTLKGYMQSQFRSMGDGILEPMKPRLQGVTQWLMDNEVAWSKWKDTVEHAGRQASEWVFSRLETGFKHIRDNYLENKEFHDLDFEGKVKFIMEDIGQWWSRKGQPALSSWWDGTGKPMAEKLGTSIGSAMVTGIAEGVKQGVSMGLGMWGDTLDTAKEHGVFSKETGSSLLGAAGGTALLAGGASLILHPLTRMIRGTFKGGKKFFGGLGKGAQWIGSKLPGKGKSTPKKDGHKPSNTRSSQRKARKSDRWWGKVKMPSVPDWLKGKKIKTPDMGGMMKKIGRGLKGGGKFLSKGASRFLGPVGFIESANLADKGAGSFGDWLFGHKEGQMKVPGIFDFSRQFGLKEKEYYDHDRQGALSKAWNWMFGPKKASAESPGSGGTRGVDSASGSTVASAPGVDIVSSNAKILATYLAQASSWVVGAFHPLQGSGATINHSTTALNTWIAQASGWVVGAFFPIQGSGERINHSVTALNTWLAQSSNWVVGAFAPLQGSGEMINHSVFALNTWLAQSSSWVVGAFAPLQNSGESINHNVSALNLWLAQSSGWVVGAFQPLLASGQQVSHNLSALSTWTAQASNWVVGGLQPIQTHGPLVSHNLSALVSWLGQASGWVASLYGIQSGADAVIYSLASLASRIRSVRVPRISAPKLPSFRIPRYAKGTKGHSGGPAIVGDGGGSELVKFPNGRTWLSPATDTMVDLPKGTQVLPHNKTKKLVDVPKYADGVGNVSTIGNTVVKGDTHNNIGDTHVTVVLEGGETNNPEILATMIADEVAGVIAEKIDNVGKNMPISEV